MKTTVHFLDRRSFVPQYDLEFDILYAYKVATQVVTTTKKQTKIGLSSINGDVCYIKLVPKI